MNAPLIKSINAAVSKVVAARKLYGDAYTDTNILPEHEKNVATLIQHYSKAGNFGLNVPGPAQQSPSPSINWVPPSEVTGFRLANGTIIQDPALIVYYTDFYNLLHGPNPPRAGATSATLSSVLAGNPDISAITAALSANKLSINGAFVLFQNPVTGSDVLNTAYAGTQQAIDNALTTATASLATQRDALKASLQSQHDAIIAQANAAITAAGSNTTLVASIKQQMAAADQALASGLSGIDDDYNSAVAQAQAQANEQQQAVAEHLTDIVAVQGITDVQNQLSNLLLNPVGSPNVTSTGNYPTPTFTAPPPPYSIPGFNPAWDTTAGDYYTTIYDYRTSASATASASSATSAWINESTGLPVLGPTGAGGTTPSAANQYTDSAGNIWSTALLATGYTSYILVSSATSPAPVVPVSAPTGTTWQPYTDSSGNVYSWSATGWVLTTPAPASNATPVAGAYPTASFTPPAPPNPFQSNPVWNTTYGVWMANMLDSSSGQVVLAYVASATGQWINNTTGTPVVGLASATAPYVPPPTTGGIPSGTNYYTDAQGNVYVQDPTTGQYTLYMSGTGTTTAADTTSLATDQSGTVPEDYNMFADTGTTPPATTTTNTSTALQYGLGSDGNYYVMDPTTGQWTYYGPGPGVTAAPAATTSQPASSSLFGWGFGAMVTPQGQSPDIRSVPRYDDGFKWN